MERVVFPLFQTLFTVWRERMHRHGVDRFVHNKGASSHTVLRRAQQLLEQIAVECPDVWEKPLTFTRGVTSSPQSQPAQDQVRRLAARFF